MEQHITNLEKGEIYQNKTKLILRKTILQTKYKTLEEANSNF